MKSSYVFSAVCALAAAALLSGCEKSKSPETTADSNPPPPMPKTQEALATAADQAKKTATEAAGKVVDSAKTAANDAFAQLVAMAKAQGDNVLTSLAQDLGLKAKTLTDACGGNPAVTNSVNGTVAALLGGKDSDALGSAFQIAGIPSLTASQVQLAKEVGNLASAFAVQKNFASLEGAKGDVATLVNALRNGEYASTLQPLQKIMNNASLTQPQKDLLSSVADKYAPALKQAAGTLQKGLQGIQGLPGLKK